MVPDSHISDMGKLGERGENDYEKTSYGTSADVQHGPESGVQLHNALRSIPAPYITGPPPNRLATQPAIACSAPLRCDSLISQGQQEKSWTEPTAEQSGAYKHEWNPSKNAVVQNDGGNESTSKQENKDGSMASRTGGGPTSPGGTLDDRDPGTPKTAAGVREDEEIAAEKVQDSILVKNAILRTTSFSTDSSPSTR